MAVLARPSTAYRDSFLAAAREFAAEGGSSVYVPAMPPADFDAFVRAQQDRVERARLPPGLVPETVLWLVDGAEFIGRISIRHELNESLRTIGGHIGYAIRPSRRRQGWGTTILRLALPETRALGLRRVLVTCDADNIGSRKIIEANGGRLENEITLPGEPTPKRRYWIDLEEGAA